ncbi:MAG: cytochrome c [Planctomycetota bacterium]
MNIIFWTKKYVGKKLNMKYSLIIFSLTIGISIITASCKKSEEVKIEKVEEIQELTPEQGSLAGAMKEASRTMRRLARTVESNDWVEMAMWTEELKENIGFNCVELYMIENNDIPNEFTVLSSKFNSALNKLILCSKEQDTDNANLEFNNLVKSCDACHESFNKDAKTKLDFSDSG